MLFRSYEERRAVGQLSSLHRHHWSLPVEQCVEHLGQPIPRQHELILRERGVRIVELLPQLVAGAGNAMGAEIADGAVIVKMIRVMMLAPVLLIMSLLLARRTKGGAGRAKVTIPWFAFGFLAVIGFNSLDLLPEAAVAGINSFDTFLLTMAMTALGTETSIEKFKRAGAKPFLLAGLLYLWLLGGGYLLSRWIL